MDRKEAIAFASLSALSAADESKPYNMLNKNLTILTLKLSTWTRTVLSPCLNLWLWRSWNNKFWKFKILKRFMITAPRLWTASISNFTKIKFLFFWAIMERAKQQPSECSPAFSSQPKVVPQSSEKTFAGTTTVRDEWWECVRSTMCCLTCLLPKST